MDFPPPERPSGRLVVAGREVEVAESDRGWPLTPGEKNSKLGTVIRFKPGAHLCYALLRLRTEERYAEGVKPV
jgi:hypothetical protein